jgi:hypothetical protein
MSAQQSSNITAVVKRKGLKQQIDVLLTQGETQAAQGLILQVGTVHMIVTVQLPRAHV